MKFSIICLTYKRSNLLNEALYSVLQQTYKNFELLIINDNSLQKLHFDHPQVKIFNLDEKFKTLGDKRNFGVSNATGDLILQLDDDDLLLPTYLENLKNIIGTSDFLYPQKPIMYYNDPSKIHLSPHVLVNTFLYKKSVGDKYHYDSMNFDELTPFYLSVKSAPKLSHRMALLKPEQCGYVYRQDVDSNRKYTMGHINKPITEQNEILNSISDITGDIILIPKWEKDYVSIIKNNCKYPAPQGKSLIDKTIEEQQKSWKSIRISWENAVKFVEAVNSRGLLATAADVLDINKESGEKVSDEIYNLRRLSCFGNKEINIPQCDRLRYVEGKGNFCSSCGCGANNLAKLDGEGYTKLHYPYLECPLKKSGFSNSDKIKPPLSIIINVLNDNIELNLTIKSIRETSPSDVEIIVIDDKSDIPAVIEDKNIVLTRLEERKGVGATRWLGAQMATSDYLLFIDSHMRFESKWYDNAIKHLQTSPHNTVWCAVCLGLEEGNMDIKNHKGSYNGARLALYNEKENQVFEGKWIEEKDGDDYEISCMMGACYFFHKSWFLHIKGTSSLKMWGSDEPLLSLKTWLAGGEIRLMKSVRIGHKFRPASPYITGISYLVYNKLRSMYMLLPEDLYKKLADKIPNDINKQSAIQMMETDRKEIDIEREYYKTIFTKDVNWLSEKFNIKLL